MKFISTIPAGKEAVIVQIDGDTRFLSRITSIGLTPGCNVKIIKNDKNRPLLVYSRDTMIALNKKECTGIMVEEVTA
jgi:ferrous iron transport protein A